MIDLRDENAKNTINGGKYSNLNIPVTSQQGLAPLSPYLNFDPAYLPPSQPEYIFPEGAAKQRGRFELAFSQIGAACIIGAGIGGATGLYRGIKATSLADQTGKLRRTQLINHVMKSGSSLANTFGIVSVMYSGFGVLLSWVRGTDDSLNTLAAATGTGMLFKSTTGLKKCALGGCIGLGIASVYCLWTNREALLELRHRNINPAFTGGDEKFCQFGVYGLIPAIIISLCLSGYHGYRSCINRNLDRPIQIYNDVNRNLNSRRTTTTVVIRPKNRTPYKQWIPAVFLTILLCCLSLAHAIVMTDGYYKSCEQYRKRLIYLLNSGREAEVIRNRLSCEAIFDFMDYLEADMTNNNKWIMNKQIDTAFAFQLAIISTWLNFFVWTCAFLLNIIMARKRFH